MKYIFLFFICNVLNFNALSQVDSLRLAYENYGNVFLGQGWEIDSADLNRINENFAFQINESQIFLFSQKNDSKRAEKFTYKSIYKLGVFELEILDKTCSIGNFWYVRILNDNKVQIIFSDKMLPINMDLVEDPSWISLITP